MSHCVHRWRIAEPTAPMSQGVCGLCGESRVYGNSFEMVASLAARRRRGLGYTETRCPYCAQLLGRGARSHEHLRRCEDRFVREMAS